MTRTSVLLCVQNARKTLHWWIAHHLAVGFDTLLICDDHSDDGTWEFLQGAAHRYDIRIAQTDPAIEDAVTRRETAQRMLVKQSGQAIGWILPLAPDEYFYPKGPSTHDFMRQLKEKYGEETFNLTMSFPINWCICGLNGYDPALLDSRSPSPRALFTRHAPKDFTDHRIVRFICRPEALSEKLPDPFSWTDHDADWSSACILHDAAASSQGEMRDYYDRNDEILEDGKGFLGESYFIAASLIQSALLALSYQLRAREALPSSEAEKRPSFRLFQVISRESCLMINARNREPVWENKNRPPPSDRTPFYLIGSVGDEDIPPEGLILWGWSPSEKKLLSFASPLASGSCLDEVLDLIPLRLAEQRGNARLFNMLDQSIFLPEDPAFRFRPVNEEEHPEAARILQKLTSLLHHGVSAQGLLQGLKENPWVAPSLFAASLFALSEAEKDLFLPPYLRDIFRVAP